MQTSLLNNIGDLIQNLAFLESKIENSDNDNHLFGVFRIYVDKHKELVDKILKEAENNSDTTKGKQCKYVFCRGQKKGLQCENFTLKDHGLCSTCAKKRSAYRKRCCYTESGIVCYSGTKFINGLYCSKHERIVHKQKRVASSSDVEEKHKSISESSSDESD